MNPSFETMMLDSSASELDAEERPEIFSMMPTMQGKDVVELGAGIGRFTGEIAEQATSVIAVDFMQSNCDLNEATNCAKPNVDVRCLDVTKMNLPAASADIVFSNWLLMYLTDAEVAALMVEVAAWLRPGGVFFFRESCFHQSGDAKRETNPTVYRSPEQYVKLAEACGLQMERQSTVSTYVKHKRNQNQVAWLLRKPDANTQNDATIDVSFQQFLDTEQYTKEGVLAYEAVFGDGYVSTGGAQTTTAFLATLDLQPGQKVLDIGCGIGGGDFLMADEYGVEVLGIDLSKNMVNIALERSQGLKSSCMFTVADCTKVEYEPGSFDAVYSRDTLLHIQDKPALLAKALQWLKPGGRLFITDYACGPPDAHTAEFKEYVKKRGYDLKTPAEYGTLVEDVGFIDVVAEDRTAEFESCLKRELAHLESEAVKAKFKVTFSEESHAYLMKGWAQKVTRVAGHNAGKNSQAWAMIRARKAAD